MTERPASSPGGAESREALQYWGYLFKDDKCGTDTLNNLLGGIAIHIATKISPDACQDLLPSQLAAFYRAVGGNYDSLFLDTPHPTLSFIYKSLGALHSLQPAEGDDGYSGPGVPALKTKGFITWQTIQLLLGPAEHVPFLQNAVEKFDIANPKDGLIFPKVLPAEAFPENPDPEMVKWFNEVNEKLTQEAQVEQNATRTGAGMGTADPAADYSTDESNDERSGAAKYFRNPLYRDDDGRPKIVRRYSRQRAYSPEKTSIYERGKGVIHGVRHFISPSYRGSDGGSGRRSSYPERQSRADSAYSPVDDTPTPSTLGPDYVPPAERQSRRAAQLRAQQQQRTPSTSTGTDSDASPRTSRRQSDVSPQGSGSRYERPPLKHRRSEDPPSSTRDYFPTRYPADGRRHSAHPHSPASPQPSSPGNSSSGFAPSDSPLFATHMAQGHNAGRRPSPSRDPRVVPPQTPDRYGNRDGRDERDERDRPSRPSTARRRSSSINRAQRAPSPATQTPSGRYPGPPPPPDFPEAHRVQSERERYSDPRERAYSDADSRRRSRSQPKAERPKLPRYVTPVDGVGGRRYVSPVWGGERWQTMGGGSGAPEGHKAPLHRVGFADGT